MRPCFALSLAVLLTGPVPSVQAGEQDLPNATAPLRLLHEDALRAESARAYCGILMLAKRNGFSYAPAAMEKGFARAYGELVVERIEQGFTILPSTAIAEPRAGSLPSQ